MNQADYISDILQSFEADDKKKQVWVLKNAKGEILRMNSGKSSWGQKNHATTALINHIYFPYGEYNKTGFKNRVEVKDYLLENKLIIVEQIF